MDVSSERLAVELVDHDPRWAPSASAEAARLTRAMGPIVVIVHHIGSTSIPKILAKPTIDLLPLVTDINALDGREAAIRMLGYDWRGEFGLPGRRFLTRTENGKRLFNVHCYEQNNPEATRHLAFRDYLRAHPTIAKAYETEKIRAAAACPTDTLAYNEQKNDWIKKTERDALAWYGQRG